MVSEGHVLLQRADARNRWTISSCVTAMLALALDDDPLEPGFEPLALGELEDFFSSSSLFFFQQSAMLCPFHLQ